MIMGHIQLKTVKVAQIAIVALDHGRDTVRCCLGSQWKMSSNNNI